jgi:hypothetical protein
MHSLQAVCALMLLVGETRLLVCAKHTSRAVLQHAWPSQGRQAVSQRQLQLLTATAIPVAA